WAHGASGGLAKVRELARELVADEIRGIDASVQTILSKPSTKEVVKSSEQTDLFQTDLQPEFHAYGQSYTSRQSRLPGDDSRRCILQVRGPLKRRRPPTRSSTQYSRSGQALVRSIWSS